MLMASPLIAQKTDKVFLLNGDELTCEIKELRFGKLKITTNDLGTIRVEWDAIDSLYSDKDFEIKLRNGTLMENQLDSTFYEFNDIAFDDIIELTQIRSEFWSSLDGRVEAGFNFNRSTELLLLNFDGKVIYRTFQNNLILDFSSLLTVDNSNDEEQRFERRDLSITNEHYLDSKNLYFVAAGYNQNTQLGIQSRINAAAGYGRDMLHNQSTQLMLGAGARVNRELSTEAGAEAFTTFEAVATVEFRKFTYDYPEIDVDAGIDLFPNLTDWGRIRLQTDVRIRFEVLDDLYFGVTFYLNFDNQPIDIEASNSDWGVVTSVGYTF